MCCPLDQAPSIVKVKTLTSDEVNKSKYQIAGKIDRTPKTKSDWLLRNFQRSELLEKIAEVADESFHLCASNLKVYAPVGIYKIFGDLHHNAHQIEHLLHSICFLGDVVSLAAGKFFDKIDPKDNLRYKQLKTAARVCHAVSHFLATVSLLTEYELLSFGPLQQMKNYMLILSITGYALRTISLIAYEWQKEHFQSNLAVNLGGFFFQALTLVKTFELFASSIFVINKIAAVAGIIHASSAANRLMTPDVEKFNVDFEPKHVHHNHDHGHHHHDHHH